MTKPELYERITRGLEELDRFTPENDHEFLHWCEELREFMGQHGTKDHFDLAMMKACMVNRIKEIPGYRKEATVEWPAERLFASMIKDTKWSIQILLKGSYFK